MDLTSFSKADSTTVKVNLSLHKNFHNTNCVFIICSGYAQKNLFDINSYKKQSLPGEDT